jgi:hypothetical protein
MTSQPAKIEFYFKNCRQTGCLQPIIDVKLSLDDKQQWLVCIIDSGADLCTFPHSIFLNFSGEDISSFKSVQEVQREWVSLDKNNHAEMQKFLNRLIENKWTVPISIQCACNANTPAYLYPITIEIDHFKELVPVLWIQKDVSPLLGRTGIFNRFDEVIFDMKNKKGYFVRK